MYHKIIRVYARCIMAYIDEVDVEFVDVQEDFEGKDVLTYICPHCLEEHQSKRFG